MGIVQVLYTAVFAALVLLGSVYLLGSAIAMWRSPDALTRLNQLSAGIAFGLPALVLANVLLEFSHGTMTWGKALTALAAIVAMLVVAAVASEVLGRSVLGVRDGTAEDHDRQVPHIEAAEDASPGAAPQAGRAPTIDGEQGFPRDR